MLAASLRLAIADAFDPGPNPMSMRTAHPEPHGHRVRLRGRPLDRPPRRRRDHYLAEGHGVDPTVDVELDPFLRRQGRNAQLERAVAEVMKGLGKANKPVKRPKPVDASRVGAG